MVKSWIKFHSCYTRSSKQTLFSQKIFQPETRKKIEVEWKKKKNKKD